MNNKHTVLTHMYFIKQLKNGLQLCFDYRVEFDNWLIGINWKRAKHEVEESYFTIHFLCFHFCWWTI